MTTGATMTGRACLVTGATSGIGRAAAGSLASMGARVGVVARNSEKGSATIAELQATSGSDLIDLFVADLSSQSEVRALAGQVKRRWDSLHVLINCAGAYYRDRHETVDGLELTFALNHIAYFLLTSLLLDLVVASAPARIVNVTSGAQSLGRIEFDDLEGRRRYRGQAAYNQSKLANVLFTYELARRLEGTRVTVNCVHPGVVRTNFGRDNQAFAWRLMMPIVTPFLRTPEKGAETVVYLASSPEVEGVTGEYYHDNKPKRSAARSYDKGLAARLWRVSEELTSVPTREERE